MTRATILMYHILGTPLSEWESKYCCLAQRFSEQMAWLKSHHHPIGLDQLLAGLDGKMPLPEKAVAVTFDDGFAVTFEQGLPILQRYEIPATMFVVAGRIGADNDWMHRRGHPKRPLMNNVQIKEMAAAGVTIGSHTMTHPRLPDIAPSQVEEELLQSRMVLEDMLGREVRYFAYPFGLLNDPIRDAAARTGYMAACSTRSGFNTPGVDRYALRRIEVFGNDKLWQFKQKLKFGANETSILKPVEYYTSRLVSRIARK